MHREGFIQMKGKARAGRLKYSSMPDIEV